MFKEWNEGFVLIGSVLGIIGSLYSQFISPKKSLTYERYRDLIFPVFDTIEPYLYQDINSFDVYEVVRTCKVLVERKRFLAGGKILEAIDNAIVNINQESFYSLCKIIDSDLDRCSFILGIHRRTAAYRINNHQYRNKMELYWNLVKVFLPGIFLLLCSFIMLACSISLISSLVS